MADTSQSPLAPVTDEQLDELIRIYTGSARIDGWWRTLLSALQELEQRRRVDRTKRIPAPAADETIPLSDPITRK